MQRDRVQKRLNFYRLITTPMSGGGGGGVGGRVGRGSAGNVCAFMLLHS